MGTIYGLSNVSANISGANVTITGTLDANIAWNAVAVRQRVREASNPDFPRQLQVDQTGMLVSRPGLLLGIKVEDIMKIAYACVPGLTWPPKITSQPDDASVTSPNAASFSITATSENNIAMTYQWQTSNTSNGSYANVSAGAVYANVTTPTLNISNTSGLNGQYYRCLAQNVSGIVYSDYAKLNVAS